MSAIITSEPTDGHLSPEPNHNQPESHPQVVIPVSPPSQQVTALPPRVEENTTTQLQCLILVIGIPCSILASVLVLLVIYMMVSLLK